MTEEQREPQETQHETPESEDLELEEVDAESVKGGMDKNLPFTG
jgi:hypothetical protein